MAYTPHDGKSHPNFAHGTRLRVYLRGGQVDDVSAFEDDGSPVYGETDNPAFDNTDLGSDWWVWGASDTWYQIIGYEVLGFE